MANRPLNRHCLWLAIAASGFLLLAPSAPASAQTIDRVVADVDGHPITTHDMQAFSAANGIKLPAPGNPAGRAEINKILKGLMEQKLLEVESKKYADKVDSSQVNNYIQTIERQNNISDAQFRSQLAANGLTYDEFRQHVREQIERMTMLQDEVRSKINIPQAEIEAYYKAHQNQFEVKKERFKLAQILIAVPDGGTPEQWAAAKIKAENIREKLVRGANFASMAKQYSDDDSKTKGGELGYFTPDTILPQIDAAVKNLPPGQISEVVRSQYGYHILKVEEHERPGEEPLTPDIAAKIRDKLATEKAKARFQSWVENDLVKEHHVVSFY